MQVAVSYPVGRVNVRRIMRHAPSPAMVVASAALLIALTGTSIAAVQATVPKNSVGSAQLKNNAVTAAKIASNAVTSAKIASNAVTGAKVQNGSLVAADMGTGQLAGDAYGRFLNGPIVVPAASTTLGSLTIPQTGSYLIWAKAYLTSPLDNTVTCRVEAGADADQSLVSVSIGSPQSLALNVAHTFAASGTADFKCEGSTIGAQASFIKITAIRLASLTNNP
jgi:hypothetical protein